MKIESIVENRKNYKRNRVLDVLSSNNQFSRSDIRKETAYSMTTILGLVEDLLEEGLVYEEECEDNRVGRKPIWIKKNPEAGYYIGIEFNAQKMHYTILNFNNEIVVSKWQYMDKKENKE